MTNEGGESGDAPISLILMDPEVLDCSICFEPLKTPIFQCENGHAACSSCCTKLKNKCASCSFPISSKRIRFAEQAVESSRVSCQHAEHGCEETLLYDQKSTHERSCIYIPCSCPLLGCDYIGPSKLLYKHWTSKHKDSGISFVFDEEIWIILKQEEQIFYFQEEKDGTLFVMQSKVHSIGNLVALHRVGPRDGSRYEFEHKVSVRDPFCHSCVRCSKVENVQTIQNMDALFVIPPEIFLSSKQVESQLFIRRAK